MKYRDWKEDTEIHELIKKIVGFRGTIRKQQTAGRKGRLIDASGRKRSRTGKERKNLRMGLIKRGKTMRKISQGVKKRSHKLAARGRKIRSRRNVTDYRTKK